LRILITTIVDPKRSAYGRLHAFAGHLSKAHDVTILSVNDSWKGSQSAAKRYGEEFQKTLGGVSTAFLTEGEKSLVRQELFSKKPLKKFLSQRDSFDLILDYNTLSIGRRAQGLGGNIPRIYDLADDLVDLVRSSPQLSRPVAPFAAMFAGRLIAKSVRKAVFVTGTTGPLLDRFDVPQSKKRVIPNGVPESFLAAVSKEQMIDVRKEPGEFLIGYVGVLREWVDFKPVFEAMKAAGQRFPVRLAIIGEEGDKEKVRALAESMDISQSVTMLGTVPHEKIRDYLSSCDCGIVPFAMTKTSDFALPLKIFEYFSAGISVISSPIRAVKDEFPDTVWVYEDSEQLAKILSEIRSDRAAAKTRVEKGMSRVAKEFTWSGVLGKLDELIQVAGNRGMRH
jgi:glycosyltransferase involved in cell wall biosynthesis